MPGLNRYMLLRSPFVLPKKPYKKYTPYQGSNHRPWASDPVCPTHWTKYKVKNYSLYPSDAMNRCNVSVVLRNFIFRHINKMGAKFSASNVQIHVFLPDFANCVHFC